MNDKEFKKTKNKLQKKFDKWIELLWLGWYRIEIIYKMGDSSVANDGFQKCMSVRSRWEYRSAVIEVWVETLPEDEKEWEELIVHELCHILVHPMRQHESTEEEHHHLSQKEEYTVETLARAFMTVKNS